MTDDELELRLKTRHRARVGEDESAPLTLRRDIAAIPRTTPRPTRRFGRGRGLTLLVAAALLVVGGAAAAGSGLLDLPSLVPPQPAPSLAAVAPTPSIDEPASPAVSPSPAPTDAGLPAQAGQFDQLCTFSLATASVGWVSTPGALYRSENLGRTWSVVSPPGWPTAPPSGLGGVANVFIDAETAYTFLPGSPATIAATHDGGATWDETALAGTTADSSPAFWFQTSSSGSLIFWGALKTDPSRVFATSDGGATWAGPHAGPSESGSGGWNMLGGGCMRIATQSVLVRTLTPPGDTSVANRLQVSHDAGATWIDRTLPVGPQAPASTPSALVDKQVIAAWGEAGGRIVMALNVMFNGGSFDQIYTSLDDGRSWQYLKTPAPLHIGPNSQFVSSTEWVLIAGSTFMSTQDGGATWRTTVASSPFDINWASFSSPDLGWAVPNCGRDPAFDGIPNPPLGAFCDPADTKWLKKILIQTTDGGRTWTQLGQQP